MVGHDVVEREERAGGGRAVVVPDVRVVGVGAEARGAFGDEVEFGRGGQVRFGGEDFGAASSGLVGDRGDDPGVMPGGIEEAVEFADVGGAESIVIVHDDVEGDGCEGEEGKEGGQGVGGWETHFERKQILVTVFSEKTASKNQDKKHRVEQQEKDPSYI